MRSQPTSKTGTIATAGDSKATTRADHAESRGRGLVLADEPTIARESPTGLFPSMSLELTPGDSLAKRAATDDHRRDVQISASTRSRPSDLAR